MFVTKENISKWGNYSDRNDSYDDENDIRSFKEFVRNSEDLLNYIGDVVGREPMYFRPHHYGKYGVDLSLVNKEGKTVADFDLERWAQWKDQWPSYYRYVHFLGRKDKYLSEERPFFFVALNFHRNQCVIVEKSTIVRYPVIDKPFKAHRKIDRVREIPLSEGKFFSKF